MRRLGRKYLLVLAAGAAGGASAVVAAAVDLQVLSVAGLALALVCVLAALAWLRLDLLRLRSLGLAKPASTPSSGQHDSTRLADQVRQQRLAAEQVDEAAGRTLAAVTEALQRHGQDTYRQSAALLQLVHRYPSRPTVRLEDTALTPVQLLDLVDLVHRLGPHRALSVDLGSGTIWLGHALAELGSSLSVVAAADSPATDDLERVLAEHGLRSTAHVHRTASVVPDTPHAYLAWHDLSVVEARPGFDLAVVGVPDETSARAALPVLPLVQQRLVRQGMVVVAETPPDRPVGRAWAAASGWSLDTTGTALSLLRGRV